MSRQRYRTVTNRSLTVGGHDLTRATRRIERTTTGGILILSMMFAVLLLFVLSLLSGYIAPLFLLQYRHQQALDAAALKAASELSEIVINDPYWGYVALSDYPAIGTATMASDGEPLPVHGINSIMAACRADYIIATQLGNPVLEELSTEDLEHAREARRSLEDILRRALAGDCSTAHDMNGEIVHVYSDAWDTYKECLAGLAQPNQQQFKLTLGWLNGSASTVTPIPQTSAQLHKGKYFPDSAQINGCYRACMDIPVEHEHFTFAALAAQPSLANCRSFAPADLKDEHPSSVVQVQAACQAKNLWDEKPHLVTGRSCGEPYQLDAKPVSTVLLVSFPGGRPGGIASIGDVLSDYGLRSALMNTYIPKGNDYPNDESCQLEPQPTKVCAATSVALCFHDWLRSNYALPKVDSVMAALSCNLNCVGHSGNSNYVVAIDGQGNVVVAPLRSRPFLGFEVQENQLYAVSTEPIALGNQDSMVVCRDEVRKLGTTAGGKHAGQALAGNPINWDELTSYVDPTFVPVAASRKPKGIHISGNRRADGSITLENAVLEQDRGGAPEVHVRTATYGTTLAAEISIAPPSVVRYW